MKVTFKHWYKVSEYGNVHFPILQFSFGKDAFLIVVLGFELIVFFNRN